MSKLTGITANEYGFFYCIGQARVVQSPKLKAQDQSLKVTFFALHFGFEF
jgi:hypothetical protein